MADVERLLSKLLTLEAFPGKVCRLAQDYLHKQYSKYFLRKAYYYYTYGIEKLFSSFGKNGHSENIMISEIQSVGFENVMNEEQLKSTARHVKSLLPKDGNHISHEEIDQLHKLFNSIFVVASAPALTAPHRVAAWNALCALIDQCVASRNDTLVGQIWTYGIWDNAFELYLSHSRNARPKSSKQLLVTLTTALRWSGFSDDRRLKVVRRLIHGIANLEDLSLAKASILVLSHFLNKALLPPEQVLQPFAESNEIEINYIYGTQCLLSTILNLIGRGDFNSAIGQAIATILDTFSNARDHEVFRNQPIWIKPIMESIMADAVNLDQIRIHIFPVLFRRSVRHYTTFLNHAGLSSLAERRLHPGNHSDPGFEVHNIVLSAALQAGKELGVAYETEMVEVQETNDCVLVPLHVIDTLFRRSSRSSRLSGLSFLISAHSMTRPFPLPTLIMIRRHLSNFFADTDANLRGEVFSFMQLLMDRMRAITAVLARDAASKSNTRRLLDQHKAFLHWLLASSTQELRPTGSYQRHVSALKTISIMCRSGLDPTVDQSHLTKSACGPTKWPFHFTLISPDLRRLLIGLLMDPFDDIRQTSASILSITGENNFAKNASIWRDLEKATPRAENIMLGTGRADHADGVAHLASLLYKYHMRSDAQKAPGQQRSTILLEAVFQLDAMLMAAKDNIFTAAKQSPLHGRITSLRYMVMQSTDSELNPARSNIISCLFKVWDLVKTVLCDDAPEGYRVDESDEMADFSTKDTLSYCWRALKESSLLLGAIVSNPSTSKQELVYLSDLCFEQLAELRHRGAFSTVAQSWATCCLRCSHLERDDEKLLLVWYAKIRNILERKVMINTRRSAGIPSLLCGLLIADTAGQLMAMAFEDMSSVARMPVDAGTAQQSSLPQVHAMNCIKDLLKNTRLGERSERYVPAALGLAADSLRSEAWAVRNCGLMLFRAVIDRLLGTNDGRFDDDFSSSRKLTAGEYPELFKIVLTLIGPLPGTKPFPVTTQSEGVFPALQLLQRIRLSKSMASEAAMAILELTASNSWHIRDKAARTYAMIVDILEIPQELKRILDLCTVRNQNALHGLLLCARYLVTKVNSETATSNKNRATQDLTEETMGLPLAKSLLRTILDKETLYHVNGCNFTRAAYIDVLTTCISGFTALSKGRICWNIEDMANTIRPILFAGGSFDILNELMKATSQPGEGAQTGLYLYNLPEVSVLRAALAQSLPYALILLDGCGLVAGQFEYIKNVQHAIDSLVKNDPDAACVLFRTFQDLSSTVAHNANSLINSILLRSGTHILEHLTGSEVAYAWGEALLSQSIEWSESQYEDDQIINARLLRLADQPHSSHEHVSGSSLVSQHHADQNLQLRALFLDFLSKSLGPTADLSEWPWSEHVTSLVLTCKSSINDTSGLCSREAASHAISRFNHLWPLLRRTNAHVPFSSLHYYLTLSLYDLLNDDDEDIRLLAAKTTSRLLRAEITPPGHDSHFDDLDPLVAVDELVKFILTKWHDDEDFATEAFHRAFGFMPPRRSPVTKLSTNVGEEHDDCGDDWSVSTRLRQATRLDTALFAAEKSNLYIDEARETRIWSRVVSRLMPSQQTTIRLIRRLAPWVIDGWRAFREYITATRSDAEGIYLDDGGGNSSSRAEVYTLSLQLVYATDLLLDIVDGRHRWADSRTGGSVGHGDLSRKIPFKPSELRLAVEEFYIAYVRSDAHVNVLWRWEVERLFARVIQQAFGLARSRATAVHSGIEQSS